LQVVHGEEGSDAGDLQGLLSCCHDTPPRCDRTLPSNVLTD
jgi:hypothetical protein